MSEEASRTSMVLKHSREVGDKNKDVTTLEWNREGTLLATGKRPRCSTRESQRVCGSFIAGVLFQHPRSFHRTTLRGSGGEAALVAAVQVVHKEFVE